MARQNKQTERIFKAKRKRRKALARLPVEEKFKLLLQLQALASPILKSRNLDREPWMTSRVFQVKHLDLHDSPQMLPIRIGVLGKDWINGFFDPSLVNNDSGYISWPGGLNFKTNDIDLYSHAWKGF